MNFILGVVHLSHNALQVPPGGIIFCDSQAHSQVGIGGQIPLSMEKFPHFARVFENPPPHLNFFHTKILKIPPPPLKKFLTTPLVTVKIKEFFRKKNI